MNYGLSDEQELLKDQLQALLGERATFERFRDLIDSGARWDAELWAELAGLGFLGAGIGEDYGGAGLGIGGIAVILEQFGRRVVPLPYFASLAVAAQAIELAGTEAQKRRWLPSLASGDIIGTFAFDTDSALVPPGLGASFCDGRLTGTIAPVPEATIADLCVVDVGEGLAVVELKQPGVTIRPLIGFDEQRGHASIEFARAEAALMEGAVGTDVSAAVLDRAAVFQAFEQVGGAESALHMARDYSMQRYIFGRTLASYQATKHKLAEILIQLELARSLALAALAALAAEDPLLARTAAAARLAATRAYEGAARENLQVHGGIGFTWEADVHVHLRRARLLALDLGTSEEWTDRLIDNLAQDVPPAQAA